MDNDSRTPDAPRRGREQRVTPLQCATCDSKIDTNEPHAARYRGKRLGYEYICSECDSIVLMAAEPVLRAMRRAFGDETDPARVRLITSDMMVGFQTSLFPAFP